MISTNKLYNIIKYQTNYADELYYDQENDLIWCRKFIIGSVSLASTASFLGDAQTVIILTKLQTSAFNQFIKIDIKKLDTYSFLYFLKSSNAYCLRSYVADKKTFIVREKNRVFYVIDNSGFYVKTNYLKKLRKNKLNEIIKWK